MVLPEGVAFRQTCIQHLQSRHVGAGKTRPDNTPAKSRSPKIVGKRAKPAEPIAVVRLPR